MVRYGDIVIIYEGPSLLDGSPIVAIATGRTRNPKTGPMIQTWIIRSDMRPMDASEQGADASVCGDCPQRWALKGGCYANPGRAPTSVYEGYVGGNYADPAHVRTIMRSRDPVRLGAYGDPAAVPALAWATFIGPDRQWTGYTHQWRTCELELRTLCMASVDTAEEEQEARALGWRTFRVLRPGENPGTRTVECLNKAQDMTCDECLACDGAKTDGDKRAGIWIRAHGAVAKRYTARSLPVLSGAA